MPTPLQDTSESARIAAIENNLFAFFREWKRWSRMEVHDDPECLWSMSDIPFPLFNFIMRASLPDAEADKYIESAIARCKSHAISMLWWTGPASRPTDLGTKLIAHHFDHIDELPGMSLNLASWNDTETSIPNLIIKPVLDTESARIWAHTLTVGYELPLFLEDYIQDAFATLFPLTSDSPLRHYLAWLNGEPVATSTLWLGAGVAGIYNVAAVNEARGQGIGTSITTAPLRAARAAGYRMSILHASHMGLNLYRRLGFQHNCDLHQYIWSP